MFEIKARYPSCSTKYIEKAFRPNVVRLLVIAFFDLDMKETNFYLKHGGRNTGRDAMKEFTDECGMYDFFLCD